MKRKSSNRNLVKLTSYCLNKCNILKELKNDNLSFKEIDCLSIIFIYRKLCCNNNEVLWNA